MTDNSTTSCSPSNKTCFTSPTQFHDLYVVNVTELCIYSCVLIFLMHNIWRYLIEQGRYKVFTLYQFYILGFLLVSSRMTMLIILCEGAKRGKYPPGIPGRALNYLGAICSYSKMGIGVFQGLGMCELGIYVKQLTS